MTNNAVKRLAKLRQRERICDRSIKNQISIAISFEKIPDQILHLTRPFIYAVRFCRVMIGLFQRGQHFRTNARGVVTRELVILAARLHVDLASRVRHESKRQSRKKERLPDEPEPQGLQGPPGKSL
jgi:hypothetical protein